MAVEAGRNGLYFLVSPEYFTGIQRYTLLQLPYAALDLLHPLIRRLCLCPTFHGPLDQSLHFLPHPLLALVDELRVELLLDLHLAGQDVARPVILELSPELANAVI